MLSATKNTSQKIKYVMVAAIFAAFFYMFWPFTAALILAGSFAFALNRYVEKLTTYKIKKFQLSFHQASLIIITGCLIFITAPLVFIVLKIIAITKEHAAQGIENSEAYKSADQLLHQVAAWVTDITGRFGLKLLEELPKPNELLNTAVTKLGPVATDILTMLPQIALGLLVFILALYYFLNESKNLKSYISNTKIFTKTELDRIINILESTSHITLVAAISIALMQSFIVSIVAYFCGFEQFTIIFISGAVFSLLPMVGSVPITAILILISLSAGNIGAVIALVIAAAIAGTADNVVRSFMVNSGEKTLHPVISLLSIIGAIIVYGALGILIGPIITQLALNILPILKNEEI